MTQLRRAAYKRSTHNLHVYVYAYMYMLITLVIFQTSKSPLSRRLGGLYGADVVFGSPSRAPCPLKTLIVFEVEF